MSKYCRPWNPVSANSFNMSIASQAVKWGIGDTLKVGVQQGHVSFPQDFMALKLTTLLTYTMH